MEKHEIQKVRLESVRRTLQVVSKQQLGPRMLRVCFHSGELQGFSSPSPDDHIKLFIPGNEGAEPAKRDFTPRAWDAVAGTFTIDFALHSHGPATEWAQRAQPGDQLEIGGPRGSTMVPDDFDWYLLIGDLSAIPSFSRRLETLRPGVPVLVFMLADESQHELLSARENGSMQWLASRNDSMKDASLLQEALRNLTLPPGDGFVWIAAESTVSRELYRYLVEERGHPAQWIKSAAYWKEASAQAD